MKITGIIYIMQRFAKYFFLLTLLAMLNTGSIYAVSLLDGGGVRHNTLTTGPRSFTQGYTARNVGDVVTVKIIENISTLKQSEIQLNNSTQSDADLVFRMGMTAASTLTPETNDVANMITNFALPVDYERRNNKNIGVRNREEFFTMISCLVVETDPESGNMVVEGNRQILMEGETKSLYVRGVVFPKDLDANNEVPSYKLANAQIQIIGSGSLTKDRDNGVIQKIFRKLF
jgi:flagellar L-ring protein precursor FlgH